MTDNTDDFLLELALQEHIAKILQANDASFEQAELGSRNPKVQKLFGISAGGGVVTFQGKAIGSTEGEGRTTVEAVGEYLRANKYGFLVGAKEPDPITKLNIDPADIAAAKAGNLKSKGKIFLALHGDKPKSAEAETLAKLDAVLAGGNVATGEVPAVDAAVKAANDHKKNPFSKAGWNVTAQGRLLSAVGAEKCAQIAASVSSHIGATHPTE
jgi:hypothetical protein